MTTARKPLLVVDDDENNLDMLSRRLRRSGYAVEVASSAKDALSVLESTEMELVLLDNMMPEMNGIDLLRLLRATQSPSQLPVIMVTAIHESKDIVEALNLGANDYITKPVDMAVALARIETQLRRKRAEEDLRDSQERLALAMRGTSDGMWDWDLRSGEVFYSTRWKAMLGYSEDEIGSTPEEWLGRVHRDDIAELGHLLALSRGQSASGDLASEHRLRHKNGSHHWMLCRAVVQRAADGSPVRMAGSITDVTQTKACDPLTGLPNRLAFLEYLQDMLDEYRSGTGGMFAVLFIDLDRFKLVNDSLGHSVGDSLLMEIARRLAFAVRSTRRTGSPRPLDALARFGGDEFALVIENVENAEDARSIAIRLLQEINRASLVVGRELFITASVGLVMGSAEYTTAHELIRDADTAMYRAKSLGKARCEVFDAEMREDAMFRLEMENDLQRALSQRELEVFYQPKVDVKNHRIEGFEALLRWRHPARGLLTPMRFISVAEETGLIVPIGLSVLEEACHTMHQWHKRFPSDPPLNIAVNLSVRQFRQPDLVDRVQEILKRTALTPGALQIEITESILVDDTKTVLEILARLKALGIGLKIDDFGTGYSSLKQLADMPVDGLKIDRYFVMRLGNSGVGDEVVRTIISLAQNLGIGVVAEGVETLEQFNILNSMGCHLVQGYYFSPALPEDQAEQLLLDPGGMENPV